MFSGLEKEWCPLNVDPLWLAASVSPEVRWVHGISNQAEALRVQEMLSFVRPDLSVLVWPEWESSLFSHLLLPLEKLWQRVAVWDSMKQASSSGFLLLLTPLGMRERLTSDAYASEALFIRPGTHSYDDLLNILVDKQFERCDVVMTKGSYAIRGSLIDFWPISSKNPLRADFFDQTLEALWAFDPLTQRRSEKIAEVSLKGCAPYVSEVRDMVAWPLGKRGAVFKHHLEHLWQKAHAHQRLMGFIPLLRPLFEPSVPLLKAIDVQQLSFSYDALEALEKAEQRDAHKFERFCSRMVEEKEVDEAELSDPVFSDPTLSDLTFSDLTFSDPSLQLSDKEALQELDNALTLQKKEQTIVTSSHQKISHQESSHQEIGHQEALTHQTAHTFLNQEDLKILRETLFFEGEALSTFLKTQKALYLDPLAKPPTQARKITEKDEKLALSSSSAYQFLEGFYALEPLGFHKQTYQKKAFLELEQLASQEKLLLTASSKRGLLRWKNTLSELNIPFQTLENLEAFFKLPKGVVGVARVRTSLSFKSAGGVWLREADFWADELYDVKAKASKQAIRLKELPLFKVGDYITHETYGIGRYEGLESLKIADHVHDCLKLVYAEGAILYVLVENMNQLTHYGSSQIEVGLDRLGSGRFLQRKSKAKARIEEMAHTLLDMAAERSLSRVQSMAQSESDTLGQFAKGFPYLETEDQQRAIEETLNDLSKTTPMDRLVCGDVGFGKTEVALRAAFVATAIGRQVALVVPTTLLARQHTHNFEKRFRGTGVRIASLSRLQKPKEVRAVKEGLASGEISLVIATHAILAADVRFKDLGLLIIDEEQHFGVAHKEKLKTLKKDVHVLTLTATPIPRTLYMALSDLKTLSLIQTPPSGRQPVETHLDPFSEQLCGEVLEREKLRSGQSFIIVPRIQFMPRLARIIQARLPDFRLGVAHGQMSGSALEKVMLEFEDGNLDGLLATNIIGSGIDLSSAGTLIVDRADLFGLADLYQLRGRVGRSDALGYAYLTYPDKKKLAKGALKRLEVMRSLDYLGAGFQVASYDMDLRGAGNLVGAQQSGHMLEVGVTYYQKLLADAMEERRALREGRVYQPAFEPQINYPKSVCFPEEYIKGLELRLGLYRRASLCNTLESIEDFKAELSDRFGALPFEAENFMCVMRLKILAEKALIERIEMGPKASVLHVLRSGHPNPAGVLNLLQKSAFLVVLRGDQTLLFKSQSLTFKGHLEELERFLKELALLV